MNAIARLVYLRNLLFVAFAALRLASRKTEMIRSEPQVERNLSWRYASETWFLDHKWGITSVSFASHRLRRLRDNMGLPSHMGSRDKAISGIPVSNAIVTYHRVKNELLLDNMITLGSDVNYVPEDANDPYDDVDYHRDSLEDFWGNCVSCHHRYCDGPWDCD